MTKCREPVGRVQSVVSKITSAYLYQIKRKKNQKGRQKWKHEILIAKIIQLTSSNKLKSLSASKFYKTIIKMSFIKANCSCAHDTYLHLYIKLSLLRK